MGRVVGPSGWEEEKEGCGVFGDTIDPREEGEGWDGGLVGAPGEPFDCCEPLFCGGEEVVRPSGPG
jgi:hypothetical protein